jgi:hypothetical protein
VLTWPARARALIFHPPISETQYRMPFIRTRYLLSASQFDRYQLPYNEGQSPPYGGSKLTYADNFQAVVSSIVHSLPNAEQPGSAVFSSACFKHCTSDSGSFWGVRIRGKSLKDVLTEWWEAAPAANGAPSPSLQVIEDCTGFGCGECHHPAPPSPPPGAPGKAAAVAGALGGAAAGGGVGSSVSARAAARLHKRRSSGGSGAGGAGAGAAAPSLVPWLAASAVALCVCGCVTRACVREEAVEAERLRSVEMARPLAGRAPPPPRPPMPMRGLR